ncbi:dNTP triphosphohydrolase [Acetobacteraceae bacterium]|nr:dNTP triphosphohydrolase [Acetobacteraceae bacterium]
MDKPTLYQKGDWDRFWPEETVFVQKGRSAFNRDVGRILHSATFRRLERKTQVFPLGESDFVRTRLTHSLEVAQIAEGITLSLNEQLEGFKLPKEFRIDLDVIRACAFIHDLGHPPFGHNGETALNEMMQGAGGFEGNAQTLRILSKLEKKRVGDGQAFGMNLTARILAGALKYDSLIPLSLEAGEEPSRLRKGYYASEEALVAKLKAKLLGKDYKKKLAQTPFKTLECQIVELADDIAYSTYDVEDFFKLGLMSPLSMLSESDALYEKVAEKVNLALSRHKHTQHEEKLKGPDIRHIIRNVFRDTGFGNSVDTPDLFGDGLADAARMGKEIAVDGYQRTHFFGQLVGQAVNAVEIYPNLDVPILSQIRVRFEALRQIEIFKHFGFEAIINTPPLRMAEYRGVQIVTGLFRALESQRGLPLLPPDIQEKLAKASEEAGRKRVICDFIAGMTDRYAIEFYSRLYSPHPESIFKPF